MKDDVLKNKPEPASNEIVWAFDLGNVPRPSDGRGWRAAPGEGCNWPDEVNPNPHHEFLHKASLLIPAEFAETKTAAGRRRIWRTRLAHGSHQPSPAGGGIFVAASGNAAPGLSSAAVPGCGCGRRLAASSNAGRDVAQASAPAGCGSVPLPVHGRATTRGGTPALQGPRKDYAAPTALGRIELKIPI